MDWNGKLYFEFKKGVYERVMKNGKLYFEFKKKVFMKEIWKVVVVKINFFKF